MAKQNNGVNLKTINLKKNLQGKVSNVAEAFMDPTMAKDINNMHCLEEGSWTSEGNGYTKINASGTAYGSGVQIDGLHWLTDSNFTDRLLMAIAGKLQEVNTETGVATDVDASAGYTAGHQVDFETYNYNVFTVDGTKATPRKFDGTTGADSGGWPVNDGVNTYATPRIVETFQGRLAYADFVTGTGAKASYRSHLVLMDVDNGETCTVPATAANHGYIVGVGTGDGMRIRGMRSIFIPNPNSGINMEQLVVFKERAIYVVFGQSALLIDDDAFTIVRANKTYGAFSNRCIVQLGNDLVALNENGIITVQATVQAGTLNTDILESDKVRDILDRINLDARDQFWAIHLQDRREVLFFVCTGSSTQCNEAIVYRYPNNADKFKIPRYSRRSDYNSKFLMSHGILMNRSFYVGSYTGILGEMFTSSKYDDTGVPFEYDHAYYDFGNSKQYKEVINADAHFKVRGDIEVSLRTEWKVGGSDVTDNTLPLQTTVAGAEYGTAVYGTDYYGDQEEIFAQYQVQGNGGRLRHTLSGTNGDTGIEYLGLTPVVNFGEIIQDWI